ncbi:MAG: hypothetical protein HBSAPP02_22730 [Phycisphaerae bacterium]|nr:MAG: serine/threonine-protein phosphatase [Planctomycetia bacterium]RIK67215.1 MAG: hypothetical protein DCC66_12015 [Planctomycetota bacterium]GJQ27241.1 MAG: hypothetical protein HBSAPP02_22730 [Phycisphaerae bacterium]
MMTAQTPIRDAPTTNGAPFEATSRPRLAVELFNPSCIEVPSLTELAQDGSFELIPATHHTVQPSSANPLETSRPAANPRTPPPVAVIVDPALAGTVNETELTDLLAAADQRGQTVLILTRRPARFHLPAPCCVALSPDDSTETVRGALRGLAASSGALARLQSERRRIQHVGESVRDYFAAMDCELRLASRLQQEFLPRSGQRFGPAVFHTLFRPANWVSGDVFDIVRLDEEHVAFYLADAMGHGVAAGLLTMYVRQSIRPKRILVSGYEIIPPGEVLGMLNDRFCDQKLPEPHFITAIYAIFNMETLQLDYAVAGHPPALRIRPGGDISELPGDGALIGLGYGQTFVAQSVQLHRGDRLIVYSDGIEPAIITERHPAPQPPCWTANASELLQLPADQLIPRLFDAVDRTPGSLRHADDVSALVLDIDP